MGHVPFFIIHWEQQYFFRVRKKVGRVLNALLKDRPKKPSMNK